MKCPLYAVTCASLEAAGWRRIYTSGYERWVCAPEQNYLSPSPRTLAEAVEIQIGVEAGKLGQTTAGFPATDAVECDPDPEVCGVPLGHAS
jgi:hypothetical protein